MKNSNHLDAAARAAKWEMGWVDGRITVDENETVVDGQYRNDQRWNGWLCVRMKFDAAMEVLRALAESQPDEFILMLDGENFILWEANYAYKYVFETTPDGRGRIGRPAGLDPDYEPEVFGPFEGGWYGPGSWAWCWEEAYEPEPEEDEDEGVSE